MRGVDWMTDSQSKRKQKKSEQKKLTEKGTMGKPKGSVLQILKRLLAYTMVHRWIYLLLLFGFAISSILSLVPPWLIRIALDQYLHPEGFQALWVIAGLMIAVSVLQGAMDYINRYVAESKGQQIVYTIRQNCYRHLLSLSFSYFDHARTGDIMSRVTADAETLQVFFGFAVVHLINNALFLVGVFAVMYIWSPYLALLYLLILPFFIFGITRYAFVVRPAYAKTRRALGELNNSIQEQIQGIQVIKIFGREKESTETVADMNEQYVRMNLTAGKITAFWMPFVTVLVGMSTGLIIWFAGRLVIQNVLTLGILVGFTTYIGMMMRPIRQTGMLVGQVINAAAAAERIFEVLDTQPEVADRPDAVELTEVKGDVEFRNVSFGYDQENLVLQKVSFLVEAGETVAIVGPTGAGKSTLIHLLPRFYDVTDGAVLVDHQDIRQYKVESLREKIGIVLQHTFLFNLTIRENIAFGLPGADSVQVREAAQAAEIHDFIMSLPEQYETIVGERGVKLSGGQRQRLAIARTLLMDPPILILDEPTSSVDAETDEKIQKAIARLCENRTVFVIAHRLWTIQNADRIIVLNRGQIEQYGTPAELIEEAGMFRDIYTLQVDSEQFDLVAELEGREEE